MYIYIYIYISWYCTYTLAIWLELVHSQFSGGAQVAPPSPSTKAGAPSPSTKARLDDGIQSPRARIHCNTHRGYVFNSKG